LGLSDHHALDALVKDLLAAYPDQANDLKGGKEKVMSFFVGQAMKRTQGTVNALLLREKIISTLGLGGLLQ
jgi:aspartyl-tRNA(Asn)/glutamyl-tRNA(Gln) amidotransferase subunit B